MDAREVMDLWIAWKDATDTTGKGYRGSETQIERWKAFEDAAESYRKVQAGAYRHYFLSCEPDAVRVYDWTHDATGAEGVEVKTSKYIKALLRQYPFARWTFSSSMDFPGESTQSRAVIAIACAVRRLFEGGLR